MMIPTVHLNGTGKEGLTDQLHEAASALRLALEALSDAAPNARDYYLQGDSAYGVAAKEHDARILKVREVLGEIGVLHEAVADGGAHFKAHA